MTRALGLELWNTALEHIPCPDCHQESESLGDSTSLPMPNEARLSPWKDSVEEVAQLSVMCGGEI